METFHGGGSTRASQRVSIPGGNGTEDSAPGPEPGRIDRYREDHKDPPFGDKPESLQERESLRQPLRERFVRRSELASRLCLIGEVDNRDRRAALGRMGKVECAHVGMAGEASADGLSEFSLSVAMDDPGRRKAIQDRGVEELRHSLLGFFHV